MRIFLKKTSKQASKQTNKQVSQSSVIQPTKQKQMAKNSKKPQKI